MYARCSTDYSITRRIPETSTGNFTQQGTPSARPSKSVCRVGQWRLDFIDHLLDSSYASKRTSVYGQSIWFPPSPQQTVREVFPHTAFREHSSGGLSAVGIVTAKDLERSFAVPIPSRGNRRVLHLVSDTVQVTALPSEDVILHLHHQYYDGVRLPAPSMPFRFLIGLVSCWCYPAGARVSQVALMSFGACRL